MTKVFAEDTDGKRKPVYSFLLPQPGTQAHRERHKYLCPEQLQSPQLMHTHTAYAIMHTHTATVMSLRVLVTVSTWPS